MCWWLNKTNYFFFSFKDDGGIEFFNTIVLQPHLKLVTDLGRGYHIRCRYKNREAAIKSTTHHSSVNDNQLPQTYPSVNANDRRDYGRSLDTGFVINKSLNIKLYHGTSFLFYPVTHRMKFQCLCAIWWGNKFKFKHNHNIILFLSILRKFIPVTNLQKTWKLVTHWNCWSTSTSRIPTGYI